MQLNHPHGLRVKDAYHRIMDMSWAMILAGVLTAYTFSHIFFGTLYWMVDGVKGMSVCLFWVYGDKGSRGE